MFFGIWIGTGSCRDERIRCSGFERNRNNAPYQEDRNALAIASDGASSNGGAHHEDEQQDCSQAEHQFAYGSEEPCEDAHHDAQDGAHGHCKAQNADYGAAGFVSLSAPSLLPDVDDEFFRAWRYIR